MFVNFLVLVSLLSSPSSTQSLRHHHHRHHHRHHELVNQTMRPKKELHSLIRARSYLSKINKPPLKTIHSPDGDLIDCVPTHLQPAFDHPELIGQKPVDLPERRPVTNESVDHGAMETFQTWHEVGELCPEGTVPIRRVTEEDVLRTSSIRRFGRKLRRNIRRDSTGSGHEVI